MNRLKHYWPLLAFLGIVAILGGSLAVYAIFFFDEDAETGLGDESDIIRVPVDIPTSTPPGACTFTPTGDALVIYHAPLADPSQQRDTASGGDAYPVLMQRAGYLFVTIEADRSGWVPASAGTLDGACENLPVDDKPWSEYTTVCWFESFTTLDAYTSPALTASAGTLPPAEHAVTRRTADAVGVFRDGDSLAWISADDVRLHGLCDDLPAE